MIEKYFQLGVRFRWTKPNNVDGVRDGAVVDGIRPTAPLTYIGLGEIVSPTLMTTHVSTLGLQMNGQIQHKWLDYTPGRTARVTQGPYDILTGFMSGCIIARWNDKGINYVGHVGTVEENPAVNRLVKRKFAFAMPKGTTGFSPLHAWDADLPALCQRFQPAKVPEICALVTTGGQFYSVVMLRDGANEWYCGGAKLCTPISHDALKMQMLRD